MNYVNTEITNIYYETSTYPSKEQKLLVTTADKVTELLSSCRLLMKSIEADLKPQNIRGENIDPFDKEIFFLDKKWDYLIHPMRDPVKMRQEQRANTNHDMVKFIFSTKTGAMKEKVRDDSYKGTNKTSVSLLPPDAKMAACFPHRSGLLFNSFLCQLKDEYVFENDAMTGDQWWRYHIRKEEWNTLSESQRENILESEKQRIQNARGVYGSCTFHELQNLLRNKLQDEALPYNEILCSLTRESIAGIFCPAGSSPPVLFEQISAISKKIHLRKELLVDIPLFKRMGIKGLILFSKEEQLFLIEQCLMDRNMLDQLIKHRYHQRNGFYAYEIDYEKIQKNLIEKLQEIKKELLLSTN